MAFLNRETGEMCFADGLRLCAGFAMGEVAQLLDGRTMGLVRLPSHPVSGGRLIAICTVEDGSVQSVALCVSSIGGKAVNTSARQRAFLFARLGLCDPDPEGMGCVRIACPFGQIHLITDPHTGRCEARILYAAH